MNRADRGAIEDLFERLAKVEQQTPDRDSEAEAFIRDSLRTQPAAPYYMAQTIVVQERALAEAEKQLGQAQRVARHSRGAVSGIGRAEPSAGPGFLAGAAQTAFGVTGGVLLGNLLSSMMSGGKDQAQAQGDKSDTADDEHRATDAGSDADEVGTEDDFSDIGDFDFDQ
jgi:uncharacterized protein